MSVKVGDKVRIVHNEYNSFSLGEEVTVKCIYSTDGKIKAVNNGGLSQQIWFGEYEEINEQNTLDLIANLSAEVVRLSKRVEALERGNSALSKLGEAFNTLSKL